MWTSSQKNAIDAPVGNILVTAAAGSGKTAVMVERILNRVLDKNGVDIDKILVVTYTNAAASELKERISQSIMNKLNENPDDLRLNKQLLLIDNSKICTIHSLCLDIIKKYFYKIDLDPSFKIGDKLEIEDIKEKAIDEVFESYYNSEDKIFMQLIDEFCAGKKTDRILVEIINKIYNFALSMPNPKKWLDMCVDTYKNSSFEKHNKIILNNVKCSFEQARILCENSINLCNKNNQTNCMPVLSSDLDLICDLIDNCNSIKDIFEKCKNIKFTTFAKSYKKDMSDVVLSRVEANRESFKKIIQKACLKITVTDEDFKLDCSQMLPKIEKLCEIVKAVHSVFSVKKRDKLLIDFSDFEHFALKILEDENGNQSEEAKILADSIKEIYVDEYQDCNHIQDRIFYLLSQCENGNPNIFMVGDVKQSIYKFRDAAPGIFMDKMKKYPDFNSENKYSKISLSKNFRSRREILNTTNFIFKQIMSEEVGEIEYIDYLLENENEEYNETPNLLKTVDIAILSDSAEPIESANNNYNDEIYDDDDDEILENNECEANYIGQKIKELISKRVLIYDKSAKAKRPVTYKDIVILLRSTKNKANIFEEVFKKLGIPTFADSHTAYYSSQEIITILNYLKVIVNPIDDVNLVAVLRSGMFRFDDNELMKIRLVDSFDYFYYALLKYRDKNNDALSGKIDRFLKITNELKNDSKFLPADEFMWSLLRKTDYLLYISMQPDSKEKKLNIRLLINKASQFENTEYKGIFNFIKFVDDIVARNSDTDATKIVSENDNLVRIMSIHKSKGLEFPVVFLSQCGKSTNLSDERTPVLCHKELGIGIDYINYEKRFSYTPTVKKAIVEKMHSETLSEEERILYVGLTRAREKLYITGIINNAQKYTERISSVLDGYDKEVLPSFLTKSANSFFDFIIPSVMRHNDCKNLCDPFYNVISINDENSHIKCEILPKDDYLHIKTKKIISEEKRKVNAEPSSIYGEVVRRIEYKYDEKAYVPTNVTVTELKKMMENDEKRYSYYQKSSVSTPSFINRTSGAQLGTLMHLVLQKLDFKRIKNKSDIMLQMNEFSESAIINKEDIANIDIESIYDFCMTNLFKEISLSDAVYKEVPFKIEEKASEIFGNEKYSDLIIIQGIIDLFFYDENDNIVLVDYKTDKLSEEMLVEKYSLQLKLYAKAIKKITGKDVSNMYIYSFYNNKTITV